METTASPDGAVRYEVSAPLRHGFAGLRVGPYFWPTEPATEVEVIDKETDGPHEGNLRRLSRKTWAMIMRAANDKRLIVSVPQGDRAAADARTIAALGDDLVKAKTKIAEVELALARERSQIEPLRAQALADANVAASLRTEAEAARKEADAAKRAAGLAAQAQGQSEQRVAMLDRQVAELQQQLAQYAQKSRGGPRGG